MFPRTKKQDVGKMHSYNAATGGFDSFLGIHPEGRFGAVVLTNCSLSLINFQERKLKHLEVVRADRVKPSKRFIPGVCRKV